MSQRAKEQHGGSEIEGEMMICVLMGKRKMGPKDEKLEEFAVGVGEGREDRVEVPEEKELS